MRLLVDDEGPLPVDVPLLLAPTITDGPASVGERLGAQVGRGGRALCGPVASGAPDAAGLPAPVAQPDAAMLRGALGESVHTDATTLDAHRRDSWPLADLLDFQGEPSERPLAVVEARNRQRILASVPLAKVPVLRVDYATLTQETFDPQEGFVLSRVNGQWDVKSILKLCPMAEQDALLIFARLLEREVIELTDPA